MEPDKKALAPTIHDLRVKLCYICREEETVGTPTDDTGKPRGWTHPCSCTLIAHEDCLLKWIQTSQSNSSRAPNALKCPQCGTKYEIDSKRPILLKFLASGNKVLQQGGTYFTLVGVATIVGIAGTSFYICLTAYGAYAIEKFFGKEIFDLILTDDPVNWPWSAYINLPLLPLSLILSRFQKSSSSLVIPLLLSWFPSSPVGEPARRLYEYWSQPNNAQRLAFYSDFHRPTKMWPPPPVLFALVGVPFVKALYRRAYAWAYSKLLNVPQPVRNNARRNDLRFNEGPLVIRILANVEGGDGGDGQAGQDNHIEGQPDANANAAAGAGAGGGAEDAEGDPDAVAVQAAEQLIEINATSLGRKVGGALLIPAVSSVMGTILLRLSRRSYLLRMFLGIRQESGIHNGRSWVSSLLIGNYSGPGSDKSIDERAFSSSLNTNTQYPEPPLSWNRLVSPYSPPFGDKTWNNMPRFQQLKIGMQLIVNAFLGGSKMWVESDPVWWRNCVGFAVFVAVKDAIHLLHLWLKKRELESRHVRDRDFRGVDIRELDLLPSFFLRRNSAS